LKEGTLVPLK